MSFRIAILAFIALGLAAGQASAASSCSSFGIIKSYDPESKSVKIKFKSTSERKFFPKPEGQTKSKIPNKCKRKVTKAKQFDVKLTGGRMSVTQVRQNFSGKMMNETDNPEWLPGQLEALIESKGTVCVILRGGKKKGDPVALTTIYLPITDEEKDEIQRINDNASDV
ncbi:hypothetical protein MK489_13380 [Myxococcota bacterium]|nr:hypothetical protein [Myxococcota bacterium]